MAASDLHSEDVLASLEEGSDPIQMRALAQIARASAPTNIWPARESVKRNGSRPAPAEPAEPVPVPWQTAAEIAAETPAEISWLWQDYLAHSTVVEFAAKLKGGKTTFLGCLIGAILNGRTFLNRPTCGGPVVYLTEEGNRTYRTMLARAGLTDRTDLHVLSKRKAPSLDWEQLVAAARQKVIEVGAAVLIVDTLSKLAGFKDEDENSSGKAMEAMNPLQALTELGTVVIVVRHDRKGGGEIGESARGSSAFGGDVDVILHLSRTGGKGRENQRHLRALGRFDESPAEITVELTAEGYLEVSETDGCEAASKALVELLPDEEGDAVALVELLPELKEQGHSRTYVYQAAHQLADQGRLGEAKKEGPEGKRRKVVWLRPSEGGT